MPVTCLDIAAAAKLFAGRATTKEYLFRCPRHDDQHPTLSISPIKDLFVCPACNTGGNWWAFAAFTAGVDSSDKAAVSRWLSAHGLSGNGDGADRKISAVYDYTDEAGQPLFQVVRFEPKTFRQRTPDGAWNLNGVRRVLYRLPELRGAADIFIVEGEKDADNLRSIGLTATCNPGGAGKWRPEYAAAFAAHQHVTIIPDNDDPGRHHARAIAGELHGKVASVRILELPGLAAKGDVSDWLGGQDPETAAEELSRLADGVGEWVASHIGDSNGNRTSEDARPQPILTRLSDVAAEEVRWLWPARLARGKLGLLIGDPGLGKSSLSLDIASRLTVGGSWPDGGRAPLGNIILLTSEDGLADTVRPRIDSLGGDPARVYALQGVRLGDVEKSFSLATDLEILERSIRQVGDVVLIIIDPLSAYLGKSDTYKDSEVRAVLGPLALLAAKYAVALQGIMHLNKSGQQAALYRAPGSIAFVAAARTVFAVAQDPDDERRRILAGIKNNLAPLPPSLGFHIEFPARGLVWTAGPVSATAESLLASANSSEERAEQHDVEEFLSELLQDGQLAAKEVYQAAQQNGFSERTLKRAKRRLAIEAIHIGQPGQKGQWFWYLPKGANSGNVAPFGPSDEVKSNHSMVSTKDATTSDMALFGDGQVKRDGDGL